MAKGDSRPEILEKSEAIDSISANKSWFADMGLGQVTPFWDCFFFLFNSNSQSSWVLPYISMLSIAVHLYVYLFLCL